jgi:hypothetical protein
MVDIFFGAKGVSTQYQTMEVLAGESFFLLSL